MNLAIPNYGLEVVDHSTVNLNDEENNAVFKSVQTFIIKSKKFTP
jgi:hypothetical protein